MIVVCVQEEGVTISGHAGFAGVGNDIICAGLTQAKMNQLMKVPMRTIQSWEAGDRIPPEYVQILVLEKLDQIKNNKLEEMFF